MRLIESIPRIFRTRKINLVYQTFGFSLIPPRSKCMFVSTGFRLTWWREQKITLCSYVATYSFRLCLLGVPYQTKCVDLYTNDELREN